MKNKLTLGLTIGLLCIGSWAGWGQPPAASRSYAMRITARNSTSGREVQIQIVRTAKVVRLWYGRLDSVRSVQLRADPDYISVDKVSKIDRAQLVRFSKVVEKYKVFTQDSMRLMVSRYQPFAQLLDSVNAASSEMLAPQRLNSRRIVLDGTSVYLVLQLNGQEPREVYAHSPTPLTHPLVYRLLHESLRLYRAKRPNSFLTVEATSGY